MHIKILTWNLGSFSWMKYAAKMHYAYKGNIFEHEYFQPKINGAFVNHELLRISADIICLQEFHDEIDIESISILASYPYKAFVSPWYHSHSILIASKLPFTISKHMGSSTEVSFERFALFPVHFNSFSARKRHEQVVELCTYIKTLSLPHIVLGDTNFWKIRNLFIFASDERSYKLLANTRQDVTSEVSFTPFGMEFDEILISKEFNLQQVKQESSRGAFMDHYPVWCEVLL